MVAFRRSPGSPRDLPDADPESISALFKDISKQGLTNSEFDPSGKAEDYLGGRDAAERLFSAIRDLKENNRFYNLFNSRLSRKKMSDLLKKLEGFVETESVQLHTWMGRLPADEFDTVSTRIEVFKDAVWCLKTEILGNIEKVRDLLADTNEPSQTAVSVARQINAVFNSIDRLEVRGRDSAGISLLFVLDEKDYLKFESEINEKSLGEEFASRTNCSLLTNKSISVRKSGAGKSTQFAVALTYKVAAEIGSLGDNISYLRKQLCNDRLFQILLNEKHWYFTISAHTRWASVGEINENNCHPVDACTESTIIHDTGIIHVSLNGDIDNYQQLKADHIARGIRYPEEISCDTKIIPVHLAFYLNQGHKVEEAFRLAVNDFKGSHAISMHTDLAPGKIFLALKGSGQAVFIGLARDHYIPTSEVYGFAEETPYFLKMEGEAAKKDENGNTVTGQICVADQDSGGGLSGISAMFYDGTPIEFTDDDIRCTALTSRDIDRQDFDHYFLKEISEAPASVRRTLENRWKIIGTDGRRYEINLDDTNVPQKLVEQINSGGINQVLFIGQGTAGVAAMACANLMRHYLGDPSMRIESLKSSELSGFMLHDTDGRDLSDTILIPISQSGTTTDTNRTVDMVRKKGAWSICIVNRRDSDLTFKTDGVLYTSSGRDIEMSVAST
ncbi:MAG: SIS domain-containing protein, partial [Desulfobacteraceae bacterium]|nr:SIS domain-containing protein [Desulfobacteraceae bacterium]